MEQFWEKVDKRGDTECWPWQAATHPDGYGEMRCNGKGLYAHRVAVELDGRDPTGAVVRHTCDNPSCVNPEHLIVGTQSENMQDAWDRGREKSKQLTPDEVRKIRKQYEETDINQYELAEKYGVSQDNISCIVRREIWKDV